jgi:ElaB/YqjD/DUF883 family membrane-anchored ribosome-binding protein
LARAVEQAGTGAHNAIESASDAAHPAVDRVAFGAHQAVDRVAGVAGHAAQSLDLKGEQFKDAQARVLDQCRGYVRANPLASLGIAVAAGYLLSRLLGSR